MKWTNDESILNQYEQYLVCYSSDGDTLEYEVLMYVANNYDNYENNIDFTYSGFYRYDVVLSKWKRLECTCYYWSKITNPFN